MWIEKGFPPIQIYGTTGKNWQAAVIRHIPLRDPCSSCLFPETDYAATHCATGEVAIGAGGERVDAPPGHFSRSRRRDGGRGDPEAGAAGIPFATKREVLNTSPTVGAVRAALSQHEDCILPAAERRAA